MFKLRTFFALVSIIVFVMMISACSPKVSPPPTSEEETNGPSGTGSQVKDITQNDPPKESLNSEKPAVVSPVFEDIKNITLFIEGFEWGPAVTKLIMETSKPVKSFDLTNSVVKTAGIARFVQGSYLSDEKGNIADAPSNYLTIELPLEHDGVINTSGSSPFTYNMNTWQNEWSESYLVSLASDSILINDKTYSLDYSENCINNRLSNDSSLFNKRSEFVGDYMNNYTGAMEEMIIRRAAYEPATLANGPSNPLIIWLHGQGEGGVDPDIVILGNEVSALAKEDIQSNFVSDQQIGAYVLTLQTETYWMDEGNGQNGGGAGISRYTQIAIDAIMDYVSSNEDIDPKRIYVGGCSNGGYMTMNLIISYPDYFAAAYPVCEAYAYKQYNTDELWVTPEKIKSIKDLPIWFIHSADDTVVNPANFSVPTYHALLQSGANNAWFSMFESIKGTDNPDTSYMGHFSWIYLFNNQITGVQDREAIAKSTDIKTFGFIPSNPEQGGSYKATDSDGNEYDNIFQWMNEQHR